MKNKLLKNLIAITVLSSLSIFSFPLIGLADDDDGGGGGGGTQVPNPAPTNKVTMELMLSVDVSGSINSSEYALQKQGYINAFYDQDVQTAIELLPHGLAVAIETWSGGIRNTSNWYKITTAAEAENFANVINSILNQSSGSGSTNVTEALQSASSELVTNDYYGDILVIDISGDGFDNTAKISSYDKNNFVNNYNQANGTSFYNYLNTSRCHYSSGIPVEHVSCPPLQAARDNAVANGIIINGLPIVSNHVQNDRQHELETYYINNVIGGVNPITGAEVSFTQVSQDFGAFANAIKNKIEKEIQDAIVIATDIENSNPDPNANRKPYVIDDTASTSENTSVSVDVLANDSDPDGDSLSISDYTQGQNGTVSSSGGIVTYEPNSGFVGIDTFTYTASDGNGGSGQATVTITVGPEPPMPEETGDDVLSFPAD